MKVIGLTGGIGMGKSTAAAVFRRAGVPVFDADAVVHRLQSCGGRAVRRIDAEFPGVVQAGAVDRAALRHAVALDPEALHRLERILHPMVRQEERAFLAQARRASEPVVVLDVPLLLETGGDCRVNYIVVVSAPRPVQEYRVRSRRRMTPSEVAALIARQIPDSEKRRRADRVIRTGLSRHHAFRSLTRLISELRNDPKRLTRYRNNRIGARPRASNHRGSGHRVGK